MKHILFLCLFAMMACMVSASPLCLDGNTEITCTVEHQSPADCVAYKVLPADVCVTEPPTAQSATFYTIPVLVNTNVLPNAPATMAESHSSALSHSDNIINTLPSYTVADKLPDVSDCVKVTQDSDGIFIIDCADICRVASVGYGISLGAAEARYTCCIVVLMDMDGSDLRVQLTDPVYGVLYAPVCQ